MNADRGQDLLIAEHGPLDGVDEGGGGLGDLGGQVAVRGGPLGGG